MIAHVVGKRDAETLNSLILEATSADARVDALATNSTTEQCNT